MSAIDFGDCLLLGIVQATAFGFCLLRVVINGPFFFFIFCGKFTKRRTKCDVSYYHVSWGCNARASDRIVKPRGARGRYPLDRAAGCALLEGRPCLASVAIDNFSRDKAVHYKKNSWRFRVGFAYVGESALPTGQRKLSWFTALSATSHGLGMRLGMTLVCPV